MRVRPTKSKETDVRISFPRRPATAGALIAALAAGPALAQDAASLQVRSWAATCANCHGTEGRSGATEAGLVSLAGLEKAYLVEQLTAFRDGRRPGTIMHQLAKGYTPEQLDAIAGYFAAQKK